MFLKLEVRMAGSHKYDNGYKKLVLYGADDS